MPEGDSVHRAAERVHRALAGRTLARAELRVPRFAAVDLRGRTVTGTRARGKHLFVDIGPDPEGRDPVVLHVHLKMEGRIHVHRAGERWRFPAHTARLVLSATDEPAVEVVGTELGLLRALTPAEADRAVDHLGPDLLAPPAPPSPPAGRPTVEHWDPEEAVRRISSRADRTIGEALLDQRNLAGIGTVYRAELCFLRGVDPRDPVRAVSDLPAMVTLARRLLLANVSRPERVTTGDRRPGRRLWVYGREGAPCRRCGTTIQTFRLGGAAGAGPERTVRGRRGESVARIEGAPGDPGPRDPVDSLDRIAFRCPACQPGRDTLGTPPGQRTIPEESP